MGNEMSGEELADNMKTCTKCGVKKSVENFNSENACKDGLHRRCRGCVSIASKARYKKKRAQILGKARRYRKANAEEYREYDRNRQENRRFNCALRQSRADARRHGYNPCLATEKELEDSFDGRCKICGRQESECLTRLCMDHDHRTGKFRFWLCQGCNRGIAAFGDNPQKLEAAAAALRTLQEMNA